MKKKELVVLLCLTCLTSHHQVSIGLSFVATQAEPLVIDLKDLFQVIFNMRKKDMESSQKVTASRSSDFFRTATPPHPPPLAGECVPCH